MHGCVCLRTCTAPAHANPLGDQMARHVSFGPAATLCMRGGSRHVRGWRSAAIHAARVCSQMRGLCTARAARRSGRRRSRSCARRCAAARRTCVPADATWLRSRCEEGLRTLVLGVQCCEHSMARLFRLAARTVSEAWPDVQCLGALPVLLRSRSWPVRQAAV